MSSLNELRFIKSTFHSCLISVTQKNISRCLKPPPPLPLSSTLLLLQKAITRSCALLLQSKYAGNAATAKQKQSLWLITLLHTRKIWSFFLDWKFHCHVVVFFSSNLFHRHFFLVFISFRYMIALRLRVGWKSKCHAFREFKIIFVVWRIKTFTKLQAILFEY